MAEHSPQSVGSDTRTLPKSLGAASSALQELSDRKIGEPVKTAIDRAAKRAGLPYWRAFDLWYGKARRLEIFEADQLADALDKKRREDARNELRNLKLRIAALESRMAQTDADFHRADIDALRFAAGAGGGSPARRG